MSPSATHCLPDGVLDANAVGVCGTPGQSSIYIPSGGYDAVQGVCIMYKGLSIGPSAGTPAAEDPDGPTFFPLYFATMVSDLTADGWAVLLPAAPEDLASIGSAAGAILNDVGNDTGHGVRYLNTCLHLFDHQLDWANRTFPGRGVMVMGVSRGGWVTLKILNARSSELIGGIARCPATLWENASPVFTAPLDFYNYNFSGMDVGPDGAEQHRPRLSHTRQLRNERLRCGLGWQHNGGGVRSRDQRDELHRHAVLGAQLGDRGGEDDPGYDAQGHRTYGRGGPGLLLLRRLERREPDRCHAPRWVRDAGVGLPGRQLAH